MKKIMQITQKLRVLPKVEKITQNYAIFSAMQNYAKITQITQNYANYASAKKLRRLRTPHFADDTICVYMRIEAYRITVLHKLRIYAYCVLQLRISAYNLRIDCVLCVLNA